MVNFPFPLAVSLAILVCATAGCGRKAKNSANAPAEIYVVETVTVHPTNFRETLTATGTLRANESVALQSERAGVVREIDIQEGRPVKKDGLLVKVDDSELQAQLQRAEAKLALDQATERRQRELLTRRGISEAEYEGSLANLNIAKAEVGLIRAQLAKTEIRAPFDGIVGLRQISPGSYVTPGTVLVSVQDIASLKLDFSLPERYLSLLRPGQNITFRLAGRSEAFAGTIYALEPAIDVTSRSVLVRATVPNPDGKLLPGLFAEVEIGLDEKTDAILIPSLALIPGMSEQLVYVHDNGQAAVRKVQVGLRTADAVQIVEGLNPGDQVITTGILQLRPGMKVQAREAGSSAAQPGKSPANPS